MKRTKRRSPAMAGAALEASERGANHLFDLAIASPKFRELLVDCTPCWSLRISAEKYEENAERTGERNLQRCGLPYNSLMALFQLNTCIYVSTGIRSYDAASVDRC